MISRPSHHLFLLAFLAAVALRFPLADGQLTRPEGIKEVYRGSGGSGHRSSNSDRKHRSSSSSSSSSSDSSSSKKKKSDSSSSSSKKKKKSDSSSSKYHYYKSSSKSHSKSSSKSRNKNSSSSKSKSRDKSTDKTKKSRSKDKSSSSKTKFLRTRKSKSRDKKSDDSVKKDKSKDKSGGSKHKSKTKGDGGGDSKRSQTGRQPKASTWRYINATSGESGFDDDEKDFDILRDLIITVDFVELLQDPDDGGLDVITFFAPWDLAFFKLAERLGYDGDYDEEAIFNYLATELTTFAESKGTTLAEAIKDILRYHIGEPQRSDERLREKGSITTSYKDLKLGVDVIKKGDKSGSSKNKSKKGKTKGVKQTMLIDESGTNPKLHDKLKDIKTTNGFFHYIKSVLLPYPDIFGGDGAEKGGNGPSKQDNSEDATLEPTSETLEPTPAPTVP